VLIFRFDNLIEALRLLKENGVRVIEGERLHGM